MPAYRIEVASSARAGCNATHCKKQALKIPKGDIRQGAWVEYEERGSYKWRHWGCVTPEVLHNWHEASEGNTDLIDGFDNLPEDAQVKVQRALEQGHVDDEDWNGDIECNRWTGKKGLGMFVKGAAKKQKDAEEADPQDGLEEAPAKKTAGRKRKAAKAEVDEPGEEEMVAPKKGRGKKAKVAEDEDEAEAEPEAAPPVSKRSRAKKASIKTSEKEDDTPVKAPTTKKGRGKKSAPTVEAEHEVEDEAPESDPKPATNRKKSKQTTASDPAEKASKPQKRKTKATHAAAADEDD